MTGLPSVRTLAIDPTWNGFAFVVLEGSEKLLDWGLCDIYRKKDERELIVRVAKVVEEHGPTAIVVETMASSRRGKLARRRITRIVGFARHHGIKVYRGSREEVREAFAGSGGTKREIALALAQLFPELEAWLPRTRKAWMREDERMSIFDAASFALAVLRRLEGSVE